MRGGSERQTASAHHPRRRLPCLSTRGWETNPRLDGAAASVSHVPVWWRGVSREPPAPDSRGDQEVSGQSVIPGKGSLYPSPGSM